MPNISVLIAEGNHIARKGISALLSTKQDIDIVAEAKDGNEAIKMAGNLCPDVLIMDIMLPILSGIDALKQIKRSVPETKILILTMHTSEQHVRRALKEGVSGYLLKDATSEELIDAIMTVHKGGVVLSPPISKIVVNTLVGRQQVNPKKKVGNSESLTNRERQILRLIAEGMTNKEIAKCLLISRNTVNIHRTKIMQKLDVHNNLELVKYCIEKGIITIDK